MNPLLAITLGVLAALSVAFAITAGAVWRLRRRGRRYAHFARVGVRVRATVVAVKKARTEEGDEILVQVTARYTASDGVVRSVRFGWGLLTHAAEGREPGVGDEVAVVYLPGAPAQVELESAVRSGPRL